MKDKRFAYMIFVFIVIVLLIVRQKYLVNKWYKYRDQNIGIALEYPASWFKIAFYHCATCQYIKLFVMDIPVIDQIELRVYSAKQDSIQIQNATSFGEWIILENNKNTRILDRMAVNVGSDNYYGEEIYFEDDNFLGRIVTLKNKERVYAIEIHAIKKKWDEANSVFDAILSTVEFLE